jgi:hypothetical protein
VSVVYCQVEASTKEGLLLQKSPTECGASECDLETSAMRRSRPNKVSEQ